ncbi:MAG: hypothetical protein ABI091_05295 [Ferruginibacter sp.]
MKKELKDYLHLYLNSSISVFIFPDESITDGHLDKYRKDYPNGIYNPLLTFNNYKQFLNDGYKPILRPLSDMTDDEDCERLNFYYDYDNAKYLDKTIIEAEVTKYLLSKHFDIFGLIEAGLAIDATKIKK